MEINNNFYEENDSLLLRLRYYLNYELYTSIIYIASFFSWIALVIAGLLALVFTPFLIYVLIKVRKYGWLIFFITLIFVPPFIALLIGVKGYLYEILLSIELGFYYLYCLLLRFTVNDWCEGISWKMLRKQREIEKSNSKYIL